MKLNKPDVNIIRFDKEFSLIKGRKGVQSRFACDGYCDSDLEQPLYKYMVGIRYRLTLFVDAPENEVVGFLAETESIILEHSTPLKDIPALNHFVNDMNTRIKSFLQENLKGFDLNYLDFPQPLKIANSLTEGLTKLGLYAH